jgi:K+ transporter
VAELTPPTPAVERQVATDLVRRGLLVAPVLLIVAGLAWGTDGVLSAAYGVALVLLNFALSAALLARATRLSPTAVMAAVLGGFLVRMGLIAAAVFAVDDAGWVNLAALGSTIIVTHLGLLVWEARYLSISLAFPALKPPRGEG